ncbi:hypothetical protein FAP94_21470 [Morganella morganii]|nr:hypothetical protein [Morganella morganii]
MPPHYDFLKTLTGEINRNVTKEIIGYPLFCYFLLSYTFNVRLKLFFPLLGCFILFLSNSRVGFVLGLLALVCIFLFILKNRRTWLFISISLILSFWFFLNLDYIVESSSSGLLWTFSRLAQSNVTHDPRKDVLDCYFNSIDSFKLFFGLHFFGDDLCAWEAGVKDPNPHNSFINGYINYGIFFPIFISFIFINVILKLCREFSLICLLSFLGYFFTAGFERNLFTSYFDVIVLSSIFIYINSSSNKSRVFSKV